MNREVLKSRIISKGLDGTEFDRLSLALFEYQYANNAVYRNYVDSLPKQLPVNRVDEIPFLPISAFKNHKVISGDLPIKKAFESSGTSSTMTSKHYVSDIEWYDALSLKIFADQYGEVENYCFLALLPSYLEREGSSLIHMMSSFISKSKYDASGFYLDDFQGLIQVLSRMQESKTPTVLVGVSFALLDLAEAHKMDLSNIIFMETGGMKGRKKEMPRTELHQIISASFNLSSIHSEYGMTELMSQAYSKSSGLFTIPSTMRIDAMEITDPFKKVADGKTGLIRIVDLGNIDSCAFIQTDDLGRVDHSSQQFEVLGRLDQSDIRGCNLLVS